MRPAEKTIHNLLLTIEHKTGPALDQRILDDCLTELQTVHRSSARPRANRWRLIMQNPVTKQIAAAIIVIAGLLSLTLLDQAVAPAYALEQTLDAIQLLETVHLKCRDWDNNEFEMWVQLNPNTGIPDYCRAYWPSIGILDISRPDRSYQYSERSNYVQVNSGKLYHINEAPARMFKQMVQASRMNNPPVKITMQDEINPGTGNTWITVLVESPDHACKVYIDPATKLPVRMIGLRNDRLGEFIKDIDFIEYNIELPDGIFEFEIPEGARIFDHDEFGKYLNSPDYGISTEGMTEHEAAIEVLTRYWDALKADDHEAMFRVFPSQQPKMVDSTLVAELVSVGDPYIQNGCGIGKIARSRVRLTDGRLMEYHTIVRYRNIDGKPSCIIAGQLGGGFQIDESKLPSNSK